MPTEFASFGAFAAFLVRKEAAMPAAKHEALEVAAVLVERAAKAKIGHGSSGWPPLAESTLTEKASAGYAVPAPLLRTGELRDSIEHRVEGGSEAEIGTDDEIGLYQELGTSRGIPPRPFLGSAGAEKSDEVAEIIGSAICRALGGEVAAAVRTEFAEAAE